MPVTIGGAVESHGNTAIVRTSDGALHVAWAYQDGVNFKLAYAKSIDNGVTWTNGEGGGSGTWYEVTNVGTGNRVTTVDISRDSNNTVFVAWNNMNHNTSASQIMLRRKTVVGGWQAEQTLQATWGFYSTNILLIDTRDNVNLMVAGSGGSVHYHSIDNGVNFTTQSLGTLQISGADLDSNNNIYIYSGASGNRAYVYKGTINLGSPDTWSWALDIEIDHNYPDDIICDKTTGHIYIFGRISGGLQQNIYNGSTWSGWVTVITGLTATTQNGFAFTQCDNGLRILIDLDSSNTAEHWVYDRVAWSHAYNLGYTCNGAHIERNTMGKTWAGFAFSGSCKFDTISLVAKYNSILSDTKIKAVQTQTINSNAKVVNRVQHNIISDMEIYNTIHHIYSDMKIKNTYISLVYSDMKIIGKPVQSILSNMKVKVLANISTLLSDMKIRKIAAQQNLLSDTYIWGTKDFIGRINARVETEKDFYNQFIIGQSVPVNPTGLAYVDLKTGEAVKLTWTNSTANYGWNIYKNVGGSYIKQNDTIVQEGDYIAGGLTASVAYTFKVVGVDGLGTESAGVTIVATPTYDIVHYLNPTYKIYLDGIQQTDAILQTVTLCYGSEFSQTDFYILKSPATVGLPDVTGQVVTVYINNRLVFTGYLIRKQDVYSSSALRVQYTAINKLWDYAKGTVGQNYNEGDNEQYSGISVATILYLSGCPYSLPGILYGEQDVADLSKLDLMESMIRYAGNYKIYTSPTGVTSYYKVGYPISRRTYEIGKHILDSQEYKDITDKVSYVNVLSNPLQITTYKYYYAGSSPLWTRNADGSKYMNLSWGSIHQDTNGNLYMEFTLEANKISNVQVFAHINEKPVASSFLTDIEVVPGHCKPNPGGTSGGAAVPVDFTLPSFSIEESPVDTEGFLTGWPGGGSEGRYAVSTFSEYSKLWKSVGSQIEYLNEDKVRVRLNPVPVTYEADVRSYTATFKRYDEAGTEIQSEDTDIFIWNEPVEFLASIAVVYTYQGGRISSLVSGTPGGSVRTYHEGITPFRIDVPEYIPYQYDIASNVSPVTTYIANKAIAEYSRLSQSENRGSITIIGDETLDLRTEVNGKDIVRITHEFNDDGFMTKIDLTKESFYGGEAVLRQQKQRQVTKRLIDHTEWVQSLKYDQNKLKQIIGLLKPPAEATDPKSGASHFTD